MKRLLGRRLACETTGRYAEGGEFIGVRHDYRVDGDEPIPPEAYRLIDAAMAPCPSDRATTLLTVLKAMTASRGQEVADLEFQLVAYASEIERWPADIVEEAFARPNLGMKWWPTWSEIEERLESVGGKRMALAKAIR